ncbi:MAG: DUF4290 domain-containing protein [Saprospiraceae bacterium]
MSSQQKSAPLEWDMTYNSGKDDLVIPEYGRHVQDLARHARTIEDDEERQRVVERVIRLMQQMQPDITQSENYKETLWKHFFRIVENDIEVEVPTGMDVSPDAEQKKPEPLTYPSADMKMRHYGDHVQQLVEKAKAETDEAKQREHIRVIASYMKLAQINWSRGGDNFVPDETLRRDLLNLSDGKLKLPEDLRLWNLANSPNQPTQHIPRSGRGRKKSRNKYNRRNNDNRGGGGGNRTKNRRRR